MPRGKKHSAKQVHHLLRLVPLTSCHLALLIPVSISFTGTKQAGQITFPSPSGGWARALLPDGRGHAQGGRTGAKMGPAVRQTPERFCDCYADFFTLAGRGFSSGFLASFAFSFAANSCLTCCTMASTSTL